MKDSDVSIIIPAHNEVESIGKIISSIRSLHPDFEIIVVDDGSNDETGAEANNQGVLVYYPYNIGNGAAIKSGIRIASGKVLVFMDADGQHDPADIDRLLEHFPAFDMVVGARNKGKQESWIRAFGNAVYNRLASYATKFPVEDLTSGYRAIKSDIARNLLYLLPNTYSYPTTLTLGLLRTGRSVKYVRVDVQSRTTGKSNIKIFRDGVRFFMIITKISTFYSPLTIFLPISLFLFFIPLGTVSCPPIQRVPSISSR